MKSVKAFVFCLVTLLFTLNAHADALFTAQFAGQQTVDGSNALAITFSAPLDTKQNLDSYFSLFTDKDMAVEGSWVISKNPQVVYFTNIQANTGYKINIHKGLKSAKGKILKKAQNYSVKTREVHPMISFDSKGFILASKLSRGLPVTAVNIDQADIDFFRVKQSFFNTFSHQFGNKEKMYYYLNNDLHK